jgi:calcineurin-like phosphoesterase family protein
MVVFLVLVLVASACTSAPAPTPPRSTPPALRLDGPETVVVAAGDISTCAPPSCPAADTARLAESLSPDLVLVLGDAQYGSASLEKYNEQYAKTWGRLRSITRPVPGNHDYESDQAKGYFDWFGGRAAPGHNGYYAFDVGAWHLVGLNSNDSCFALACDASSDQARWLANDLANNDRPCLLGFWHHPRWSSGEHGDDSDVDTLWRLFTEAGADIVLNGHDHDYERFAAADANGRQATDGTVEFVVGTGGGELRPFERTPRETSRKRVQQRYGVLRLALGPDSYAWQFVATGGQVLDQGGPVQCH